MNKIDFKPAEGVTIENVIEYATAIESAVREGIYDLPIDQRSITIGMVLMTLKMTMTSLADFREKLEKDGLSTPPSKEQSLEVQMLMRRALEMDKQEN